MLDILQAFDFTTFDAVSPTFEYGALDSFSSSPRSPSPPGEERAVADRVIAELRALGLEVEEDDAGRRSTRRSATCSAACPAAADGGTPIFLCAHLDTVPPQGPLEPVVGEDGIVRNAGGTILGADNKSAVVAMIEAARRIVEEGRPHAGVELLFTPKEEVGLLGAGAFDHTTLEAELGFVFDQAAPIGDVIMGAPYQRSLLVRFHGRPAHSGMVPEEGRSAIAAAARAIADLRLGRHRRGDDGERRADHAAAARATSSPSGASSRRKHARTTRASSPTWCRRCSTRSPSPRASPSARSRPR